MRLTMKYSKIYEEKIFLFPFRVFKYSLINANTINIIDPYFICFPQQSSNLTFTQQNNQLKIQNS
jgi:hypothetical protein